MYQQEIQAQIEKLVKFYFNNFTDTTIQAKGGLNEYQINEMVKQAEAMRKSDLSKKEFISLKNEAETLLYETNKTLENNKQHISKEILNKVELSITDLNNQLNSESLDNIKKSYQQLKDAAMEIGKEIYKNQKCEEHK